jgi:hypothetical protein
MTQQRWHKGAQDSDLVGARQLIDRLRCEEGGRHGMAVADSDEERWARTGRRLLGRHRFGELELGG